MKKTLLLASCCLFALQGSAIESVSTVAGDVNATVETLAEVNENINVEVLPFQINPGKKVIVKVLLNNLPGDEFVGAQFDLVFPEGLTATAARVGSRCQIEDTEGFGDMIDTHSVMYNPQPDGSFRAAIQGGSNGQGSLYTFPGTSGDILEVIVKADANVLPGVYDVTAKNVILSRLNGISAEPASRVSSAITGTPSTQNTSVKGNLSDVAAFKAVNNALVNVPSADLSGAILPENATFTSANPNAVVYVAEGQKLANTQNVVVGSNCDNLVLTDGNDFAPAKSFTAAKATYTRSLAGSTRAAQGGWYSICLPYAAAIPANANVEEFVSFDGQTVSFEKAAVMEAGKAYIFQASEDVTFEATNVDVVAAAAAADMVGTFSEIAAGNVTGKYALRNDGTGFGKCAADAYVPAFRAYLNVAAAAKTIKLNHGEATGIEGVEAVEFAGDVYTLGGQLVKKNAKNLNGLAKGVYVVNGKKVVK